MNTPSNNGRSDYTAASKPAGSDPDTGSGYPADEAYYPAPLKATDLGLVQLRRAIIERRWLILGCIAVGLAIALAISLLQTQLYRAKVLMELNPPQVEILDNGPISSGRAQQAFLETQYGLLESEALATRVARELNLASDSKFANQEASREQRLQQASSRLRAGLTVEPERGSQLVTLFFTSDDPQQASQIANAYAENFIESGFERNFGATSVARELLEEQLASTKAELEDSERQLNIYAQELGIVTSQTTGSDGQTVDGGSLEDQSLVALNDALTTARIARIDAEQAYRKAQASGPTTEVVRDTADLRRERERLQAEFQQKSAIFRPDYPEMIELQRRIAQLDSSIANETEALTGGGLNSLRSAFQAAQSAEAELENRVNSLKGEVLSQRGQSIEANILQREVDTNRALYDALLQQYKEIGVAGDVGKSPISVVDQARPPSSPFRPNIPLNLLGGLFAGLVIGLLLAIAFELIFDTVKLPGDVRQRMGLRLLGVIPESSEDVEATEALEDPKSNISEAYASARTALQFLRDGGGPQIVFITSTRPAEGKSTTAFGLARSYARIGKKTLLIDADMRRPTFQGRSGRDGGLMRLLTSEDSLAQHVEQSGVTDLSLVVAGRGQGNAAELLASARLRV
ncbi:MAG: polysaccharide biosynthesis tyrosine autokinase, partial [Pseudomonadota bacterium]